MANTVFHRLHRIRKLQEQHARMDKVEAAAIRDERQADIVQLQTGMDSSHKLFGAQSAGELAHHHRFAVHNEMQRRGAVVHLWNANDHLVKANHELRMRAVDARSVELLAEAQELRMAEEARASEQSELDEVGSQQWLRRAS